MFGVDPAAAIDVILQHDLHVLQLYYSHYMPHWCTLLKVKKVKLGYIIVRSKA